MVNHSTVCKNIKYDYMNILTWTILKKTQILNGCETFAFKYIIKNSPSTEFWHKQDGSVCRHHILRPACVFEQGERRFCCKASTGNYDLNNEDSDWASLMHIRVSYG